MSINIFIIFVFVFFYLLVQEAVHHGDKESLEHVEEATDVEVGKDGCTTIADLGNGDGPEEVDDPEKGQQDDGGLDSFPACQIKRR